MLQVKENESIERNDSGKGGEQPQPPLCHLAAQYVLRKLCIPTPPRHPQEEELVWPLCISAEYFLKGSQPPPPLLAPAFVEII